MKINKMFTIPVIIAIASAVLLVGLTIYQEKEKQNEKLQNEAAQKEIKNKQEIINTKQEEITNKANELVQAYKILAESDKKIIQNGTDIIVATKELSEAQSRLIKANEQISLLQNQLINSSTAKDSRPILTLQEDRKETIQVNLYNDGNYPISGIKIYFDDHNSFSKSTKLPESKQEWLANIYKTNKVLDIGSLNQRGKLNRIYTFIIPNEPLGGSKFSI